MVKLWIYEDFVVVEVWGQVEEEVAAVEDDEVDHRGPVKIGGVLWVVSHKIFCILLKTCLAACIDQTHKT